MKMSFFTPPSFLLTLSNSLFVSLKRLLKFLNEFKSCKENLRGIFFRLHENKISLFVTDGIQLIQKSLDVPSSENLFFFLPHTEVAKLLGMGAGIDSGNIEVKVIKDKKLIIEKPVKLDLKIMKPAISYKMIEELISRQVFKTEAVIKTDYLLSLITKLATQDKIGFLMDHQGQRLEILDFDGRRFGEVPVSIKGNNLKIWFNPKLMINIIKDFQGEILIRLIDSIKPVYLNDRSDLSWAYIIMPILASR